MRNIGLIIIVSMFGIVNNVFAESQTTPQSPAATVKDNNDWTGDQVQIKSNLHGLKKSCNSKNKETLCADKTNYFAPAYVRFDVSSVEGGIVELTPRDNFTISGDGKVVDVKPAKGNSLYGHLAYWGDDLSINKPAEETVVSPHESYTISQGEIEKIRYVKYGWTYGALVVPYKYQRGYKAVNSSPSAQIYIGYKRDGTGTAEGPFISAGLSTADIPTAAGQADTKTGFSYGLGWIFEIKKSKGVQLIVMAGQDVFGASSGYQYEGDVWYSMSIGLSLDNASK